MQKNIPQSWREIANVLGKTVLETRREKGLSQGEFANSVGMHRTYISDVEKGKRNVSLSTLLDLCRGCDLSLGEFVALVESEWAAEAKN